MSSNLELFKESLNSLITTGDKMLLDIYCTLKNRDGKELSANEKALYKIVDGNFKKYYQEWYTEAREVVSQLIPMRLSEFENLYKGDGRRKNFDLTNYSIQDWLLNRKSTINEFTGKLYFDDLGSVYAMFRNQLGILKSANLRFESILFDIRKILQADLFDNELDAARELLDNGFSRAGGAIAGVVLEEHLQQICNNHKVSIRKKDPSISDLNDLLKNSGVIEVQLWRFIQRLGDLRNLCDHKKSKDPTNEDVDELISGVDKVIKTIS